jgi:hypothetical protein
MPKLITLKNNFHNTEIRVRASSVATLDLYRGEGTKAQRATARRIRTKLCGSSSCTCGIVRGPQS